MLSTGLHALKHYLKHPGAIHSIAHVSSTNSKIPMGFFTQLPAVMRELIGGCFVSFNQTASNKSRYVLSVILENCRQLQVISQLNSCLKHRLFACFLCFFFNVNFMRSCVEIYRNSSMTQQLQLHPVLNAVCMHVEEQCQRFSYSPQLTIGKLRYEFYEWRCECRDVYS